ncbi:MAG TPA: prolipoprotein diacylglyceryl transferase [Spirochaetia bacterium]|nr:prolipoprotein diacylglyceryl transferase [Spirochaetia bacterium]
MLLYLKYPTWISPEIIPGLPFRWYGLMYLIAFAVTYLLFMYQVKRRKLQLNPDHVTSFFFWAIIGVLVGGRLFSGIFYDPTGLYLHKPWLIFWPFDASMHFTGFQGMSYHGGLVGAIVATVIFARVRKIDILEWGDMLVAGVPLGYTFGRLGNFINGELWGRITTAPWGMVFPNAQTYPANLPWVAKIAHETGIPVAFSNQLLNLPRQPSQLYEAFFEGIVLWAVLWFIFRRKKPYPGFMVGAYVVGYGVIRFIIEYFRQPDQGIGYVIRMSPKNVPPELLQTPFDFTMGQTLSFFMIIGGVIALILFKKRHDARPQIQAFEKVPPEESGNRGRHRK